MTKFEQSMPASYFDGLYAAKPDPWDFATSAYEQLKYDATIAALGPRRYVSVFEVGCSVGVLTEKLAPRCQALLAVDVAQVALTQARERCRGFLNVNFERMRVPAEWPSGTFDLVVLSEVIYYLDAADVDKLSDRILSTAARDCVLVLVHWTGGTNYPLTGDEASERLIRTLTPQWSLGAQRRSDRYRLDVLTRLQ